MRRRFSEKEVLEVVLRAGGSVVCGYRDCPSGRIELEDLEDVERDHSPPLALGGADMPGNCSYMHGECHAIKSDGPAHLKVAGDKSKIAKAKRLAGGKRKRKGRAIPSRPFGKERHVR